MTKTISFLCAAVISFSHFSYSQGIHQTELEYFNSQGNADAGFYEQNPVQQVPTVERVPCNLNKMVYGWHPYWVGNVYQNYQWDLLSHLSFFSYEVDYLTGNAVSTHGWSTSAAVNAALATGSTKVTLCVTLFANHASFLTNATAKQTLITNLINLINTRGAHGVNIDFEGLPSSQSTNFANFMVDLANQMHAAIPGSEVSTVLYSVDWNSVFNFSIMEPEVDYYIIMGYDYYYSGSATAGPNDPLYQFGTSYNYTLSRSITDYLKAGCPKNKLILGLPNYGREWSTTSLTVPSGTTASGVSRTYSYIKNNSTGFYTPANHTFENESQSDMYLFMNGATPKQCFITEETAFAKRLQHVNTAGIGGIGIWALGYDDGYTALWEAIRSKMTDCYSDPCTGTIHDFGGEYKNYYNNENYTWTIAPPNATSLDITFSSFDVEANYDYLYVYDGNSTAAPQIPGSPFTGTTSPGTFTTSTGAVTFKFTSDISTVRPGFIASYTCNQDDVPPTTAPAVTGNWQTQNFNVTYTDLDNASIADRYSLITDHNGTQRSANRSLGYLFDDCSMIYTNQWNAGLGTWNTNTGWFEQLSETETNSDLDATLTQQNDGKYLYHWRGKIGGTGTNRRAGIHFFCSDASLPNRGDSYLVYWRVDTDKCQIYRSTADNLVLQTNDDVVVDPNTVYDFKIVYDPATGRVEAYLNDQLSSFWVDPAPITSGSYVSIRSGNCTWTVDDIRAYKERSASETVTIGTAADLIRYQNSDPNSPNGRIYSVVTDNSGNFSSVGELALNIDWTAPSIPVIQDGLSADVDQFVTPAEISANWSAASDQHSDIAFYELAVGTSSGAQDVIAFTNVGTSLSYTITGLSLNYGQMYYVTVRTTNGAGLTSLISSDGQLLQVPTNPPVANFYPQNLVVCEGDSIQLINTSTDGTSYTWTSTSGTISDQNAQNTYLLPTASGVYSVTLTATNSAGSGQLTQNISVTVQPGPIALATPDQTVLGLPNAIVLFSNNSLNADTYFWDFGDGETSTDSDPWHQYSATGTYTVMLIAQRDGCQNDTTYFTIEVGNAGLIQNMFNGVVVYPNPFDQYTNVLGENIVSIEVFDSKGKLILSNLHPNQNLNQLDLSSISKGVYLLKVRSNDHFKTIRIVKD